MVLVFFKNAARMLTVISGNHFREGNAVCCFELIIQYTTTGLYSYSQFTCKYVTKEIKTLPNRLRVEYF